jgi:formyltetrahydrofolate deformylase
LSKTSDNTAILLLHCEDQKGLIAALTDFIQKNEGHIISLDEHVDIETQHFFMRVEWSLEGFVIPRDKIEDYFGTMVATRFNMHWRIEFCKCVPRAALFVSKYAHCFFDILSRYESGEWDIEIPLIVSNHEKFRHVAERYGIPYYYFETTKETKKSVEEQEYQLMKKYNIDFIILARYMQILSEDFTSRFPNKIINIHHSSLPAFPGANPYKSAFDRGVKILGATAHYVNQNLDDGPIIAQDVIPISHNDTINEMKRKGKDIEKIVLAKAIWFHINHQIIPYRNKTVVFQ